MTIAARLARLEKLLPPEQPDVPDRCRYAGRPVEYARHVLGISTLTPDQEEILPLVHEAPFKVLVPSAHDVGKTFLMAVLTNYWWDSFNPSVVLSTAPTARDVRDLLWTEVRLQRQRAGLPMPNSGSSMPYMGDSPEHFAKGFTAARGELFKGRHRRRMLFLFDEGNEIEAAYFTTTKTMFDPDDGHAWVVCYNPTTTTTACYQENLACDETEGLPRWHRRRLSALTHPNVLAELRGQKKLIPGAVSLAMVNGWVEDWCEAIEARDHEATDIEWPPRSGKWHRPGSEFQSRALGIEPDTGDGVWGPALWEAVKDRSPVFNLTRLPEIGCDCSMGKGEDWYAAHGRWGTASVHHETANTMDPARIGARLKEVCAKLAALARMHRDRHDKVVKPRDILIKIDDDGTGGAVCAFLRQDGYNALPVGAATTPQDQERYLNKRSELWFQTAAKAKAGLVGFGRLDRKTRARLRQQLLAPTWKLDPAGRRVVEKKEDTKDKIGRSPDDADAVNLSYYEFVAGMSVVDSEDDRRRDKPRR